MKLPSDVTVSKFNIKVPIWKHGRMVGLNVQNVGTHNEVNILWENKEGERIYPNPMYIGIDKVRACDIEPVKKYPNIQLYIVPVNWLEPLEWEKVKYTIYDDRTGKTEDLVR